MHTLISFLILIAQAWPMAAEEAGRPACLFIIGDSTAAAYPLERSPLTGWAQVLPEFFDPARLRVADRARSGRSSKSFYEEGAWTGVLADVHAGDYVLIQFGHNDSKSEDPKRYTEPRGTYLEFLRRYIEETRAKEATPLLATSINRNSWKGDSFQDSMGDYPDAMRELAQEAAVPLIDLHRLTRDLLEKLGPAASGKLFMNLAPGAWPHYPEGQDDNTHLQERGAHVIAGLFVEEVQRMRLPFAGAVLPGEAPAP